MLCDKHRRIGLLGGSFDPPHDGHLALSLLAHKALRLDEVWWMVAPANPLKDAPRFSFEARCQKCQDKIAAIPSMKVCPLQGRWQQHHAIETITCLRRRMPQTHYVWLMGSDVFVELHLWKRWIDFCRMVKLAIMPRAPSHRHFMYSVAASYFAQARCAPQALLSRTAPAWTLLYGKMNPLSSQSDQRIYRGT